MQGLSNIFLKKQGELMTENHLYGTVLLKAKKILGYISKCETAPTLKEISDNISITKPTILKILNTLEYCEFVRCFGNPKRYYLGLTFLKYAQKARNSFSLDKIAMPYINELRDRTTEAVNLGIKDKNVITLLDRAQSTNTIRLNLQLGGHMNMYSSGMGKAILACMSNSEIEKYLDETALKSLTANTITNRKELLAEIKRTRTRGYAIDDGENQDGIYCLGFAILKNDKILGAFSISAPHFRINNSKKELWAQEGLKTKADIENAI